MNFTSVKHTRKVKGKGSKVFDVVSAKFCEDTPVFGQLEKKIDSTKTPHPDFCHAMESLAKPVAEICDLDKDRLTINGFSITEGKNGETGVVFSAYYQPEHRVNGYSINTPLLWDEGKADEQLLPEGAMDAVYDVLNEMEAYLDGKVSPDPQQTLEFVQPAPTQEGTDPDDKDDEPPTEEELEDVVVPEEELEGAEVVE